LCKGLAHDFEGLFKFSNIEPAWPTRIRDREYDVWLHTQIKIVKTESGLAFSTETPDGLAKMYANEAKRVALLHRKFLEDLDSGDRIYVFKSSSDITSPQIRSLHEALEHRRPQRLLCVLPASSDRPASRVATVGSRVKVAALDRFAPGNRAGDADFSGWLEICRAAADTPWE